MKDIPDGRLLWMIHFDRHNYTSKWIAHAEAEALRRGLSLHRIDHQYLEQSLHKKISPTFDYEANHPKRTPTWWQEFVVGLGLVTCERWMEGHVSWLVSSLIVGVLGSRLLYYVSGREVEKSHRIAAWIIVSVLILFRWLW
jgi:hypothetical protein